MIDPVKPCAEVDMERLPETLKQLRESRDLTQARLAEMIEASPRVYNRWETGAAAPRLDTLVKIADILNVTLDELVGRAEGSSSVVEIRNPRLHALYRHINGLSDEDQQALIILLDSLVKRSQLDHILAAGVDPAMPSSP